MSFCQDSPVKKKSKKVKFSANEVKSIENV